MSAQEILAEIQKLLPEERRRLLEALAPETRAHIEGRQLTSEEEVERILLAEGIVSEIPSRLPDVAPCLMMRKRPTSQSMYQVNRFRKLSSRNVVKWPLTSSIAAPW